jgi:hypothetical protein
MMSITATVYFLEDAMGRPALQVVEVTVRLPVSARERIAALVGPHKMATFIREAVENELARRELDDKK